MIDSKNFTVLSHGWSTPVSTIIRNDFFLYDDWSTSHVTLDDAVSYRTGYPRHDLSNASGERTAAKVVRNLRNLKASTEPRTTWQYCNLMYVTLGYVIEVLIGKWLGALCVTRSWHRWE